MKNKRRMKKIEKSKGREIPAGSFRIIITIKGNKKAKKGSLVGK
jgi:hypothetical protein